MPKNKAAESSSDTSVNSSDDESKKPAKKQKTDSKDGKKAKSSNDDSIETWELGRMKMVKVREFRGKMLVDIREYYEKDGDTKPGKKGISLTIEQWNKLASIVSEVNKTVKENC